MGQTLQGQLGKMTKLGAQYDMVVQASSPSTKRFEFNIQTLKQAPGVEAETSVGSVLTTYAFQDQNKKICYHQVVVRVNL